MSEQQTWPEQNAVDSWLGKHGINVNFEQSMELKKAVSEYRIGLQRRIAELESQQETLAQAIHDAAAKRGIIEIGTPLTGPQMLVLCNNLAEQAQAVPDGWKLVPIDPTEGMMQCMVQTIKNEMPLTDDACMSTVRCGYFEMLAAAPTPAGSQHSEPVKYDVQNIFGGWVEVSKTMFDSWDVGYGLNKRALYEQPPAANAAQDVRNQPLRWYLNEEAVRFLNDTITADDDGLTEILLHVGWIQEDDGSIKYGLLVSDAEYPEDGASLLVETAAPDGGE